jgi:hypothetical protein
VGEAVLPSKDRAAMIAELAPFLGAVFPGKPVRLRWEIARADKTPAQNRFLWAVPYTLLSAVTGFEKEDLHEWNCGAEWGWKDKPCPKSPRNPEGVESVPIRTTTRDENGEANKCSAEEMESLWSRCQRKGATLGIFIPDPDPHMRKSWRNKEP